MPNVIPWKEKFFCYYFVQNCIPNKTEVKRLANGRATVIIDGCAYYLDINYKDPRALVCFDGDIPSGGLPKGSTVIYAIENTPLVCNVSNAYKKNSEHEEDPLYEIAEDGITAIQKTKRYFVLLPSEVAIVRVFKSLLSPRYLVLDVKGREIKFTISSY